MDMDVFVIPIGRDRYELYCEAPIEADAPGLDERVVEPVPAAGVFGRLQQRFGVMLRAVEEWPQRRRDSQAAADGTDPKRGVLGGAQDRIVGWVAQRIAEQRLLWNLRRQTSAVAVHPQDMTFEQVLAFIRRALKRDYERHRVWLVMHTLGLVAAGPLALVPGPNVLAYYFAFRVAGHWLSMRGAMQGLHRVSWSGRPCSALADLRDVAMLEPLAREARIVDVAARLCLPQLASVFARVTVRPVIDSSPQL
jgi:hypothetical protein